MPSKFLIYGLVDPRTLFVRYVGKSSSGLRRPKEHRRDPVRWRTHVANWVKALQSQGLEFQIVVLEEFANIGEITAAEIWWIAYGRASGWPLTNLTDGGDGAPGHRKSPETRARIGAAHRGKVVSQETLARMSAVMTGVKRSQDSIEKQRRTITGRKVSPAHREAIARAHRGRPKSPEHRAKLSEATRRRQRGPHGRLQ